MKIAIKLLVIFALIIQSAFAQANVIRNSNPSAQALNEAQELIDQGNQHYEAAEAAKLEAENALKNGDMAGWAAAIVRYVENLRLAAEKFNKAIQKVIAAFNMDTANVSDGPSFYEMGDSVGLTWCTRKVRIGQGAFTSLPWLVSTLKHEITHANQRANGRLKLLGESDDQARARREVEAYDAEINCAETTKLSTDEKNEVVACKRVYANQYEAAKAGESSPAPYVSSEAKSQAILNFYNSLRKGTYTREELIRQAHEKLGNVAPTLEEGEVSPGEGASDEKFSYSIHYFDVDNSPPAYVDVWIDGHSYPMGKADPEDMDYTDGCEYEYSTELVPGTHTYYFRTSDWIGYTVYPEEGAISGPIVSEKDTTEPVVEIISPTPYESVSGTVTIEVAVEDNVDSSPLAEFIVNGVSIGYDETPPYEYTWDASHQEIGSEHTITVKVTDKSGNTTEAVVAVKIGPAEPTAVTASGQHLQAVFAPADIDSVKLAVEETPAPYEAELWESRASVSDWTEGFLTLSYTDVNGEGIWLEQGIHINNTTREIVGEMIDVGVDPITVGAIFGRLPSVSGEEDMTLTLDFSYPISITMGPVFQLQLQAGVSKYVTDKGREVEVFDDGRPNDPDVTEAEADAVLDALGLKDKVEKKAGPSDAYDCHGWTFTCGKKWINNDQVQKILDDNGYSETTKPKVGDVAVYKDSNGNITHTGVVREVDENGNVVDVESKWGAYGRYDHKPGDVPPEYGTPEYHHTDRPGEGEGKDRHTIKTE